MNEIFFTIPERDDFMLVMGGACLLQLVDLPLHFGAFAVVPHPFQGPDRIHGIGRRPFFAGNLFDQRRFSLT